MINHIDVFNLPPNPRGVAGDNFGLQTGQRFTMGGKHLLLTGDNGVGKSTFLKAFHESIIQHRLYQSGGVKYGQNIYDAFCKIFAGNVRRMTGDIDGDQEPISDQELLDAIEASFGEYFGEEIENFIDRTIPDSTQENVNTCIGRYVEGIDSQDQRKESDHDGLSSVFEIAQSSFTRALSLYAREHSLSEKKVYGAAILMASGGFPHIDISVNSWKYLVPKFTSGSLRFFEKARIITLLEGQGDPTMAGLSLGQRTIQTVDHIIASTNPVLAVLDEPTNGVASNKSDTVRQKILTLTPATKLVIAASHDGVFIEAASKHQNWKVVELPLG